MCCVANNLEAKRKIDDNLGLWVSAPVLLVLNAITRQRYKHAKIGSRYFLQSCAEKIYFTNAGMLGNLVKHSRKHLCVDCTKKSPISFQQSFISNANEDFEARSNNRIHKN